MDNKEISNINNILASFGIKANCINCNISQNYSSFDIKLDPKTKLKEIQKYLNEIGVKSFSNKRIELYE